MDRFRSLAILGLVILIIGYLLSWQLYKVKYKQFSGSNLQKKILMWLPIFIVVCIFAFSNFYSRLAILFYIFCQFVYEQHRFNKQKLMVSYIYMFFVSIGLVTSLYLVDKDNWLLIGLWLISVLSDVFAFFLGNYLGKFHLPAYLNRNKSWEGVVGQILGAIVGVYLVSKFITPIPLLFGFLAGIGSATGDLVNSYVKRRLKIKDWGNGIIGHGGYLDRLGSLGFAFLLVYLYIN